MKNNNAAQLPTGKIGRIMKAPIRVLCVDDEEHFLNSAKQILELNNLFHLETASSVKDALKKVRGKAFDAIVSDYQMPETSGEDES
jgi:DNA-binding NtrC family response regulator